MARYRDPKTGRYARQPKVDPLPPEVIEAVKQAREGQPTHTDWSTRLMTITIVERRDWTPKPRKPWKVTHAHVDPEPTPPTT